MFNNKKGDETDFCESYKSEILGTTAREEENSFFSTLLKLLTILILLAIIVAVSFYGYTYFQKNQKTSANILPPLSVQVSEDDLVVEAEEEKIEPSVIEKEEINDSTVLKVALPVLKEENIEQIVSEPVEENTSEQETEANLEVPTSDPEAKYLEELADLSKEIDKEREK